MHSNAAALQVNGIAFGLNMLVIGSVALFAHCCSHCGVCSLSITIGLLVARVIVFPVGTMKRLKGDDLLM